MTACSSPASIDNTLDTTVEGRFIWSGDNKEGQDFLYYFSSELLFGDKAESDIAGANDQAQAKVVAQSERVYQGERALVLEYINKTEGLLRANYYLSFIKNDTASDLEPTGLDFRKHDYLTFYLFSEAGLENLELLDVNVFLSSSDDKKIRSASGNISDQIRVTGLAEWTKISVPLVELLRPALSPDLQAVNPKKVSKLAIQLENSTEIHFRLFVDSIELQ